jgi:hypothetical protein
MKMNVKQFNWFALVGGILLLILLPISIYVSWWKLTVGENLVTVNASPVNTNFNLMGTQFNPALVWAANLTSILTFLACGIIMLIYAFIPSKPYSKDLLSFAYRKPLYIVIIYIAALLITAFITQSALGIGVPISGTSTIALPQNLTMGAHISVVISSAFQWPFWLAIVAAGLFITARIYHTKLSSAIKQAP